MGQENISDYEFVANLRGAVERYFSAVDEWEAAYQKYYRLPGYAARASDDLEPEERVYLDRRRELGQILPRAHRLCLKHNLSDPFPGLLRIALGRHAPQHRVDPAIGRSERSAVTTCLVKLSDACRDWDTLAPRDREPEPSRPSLLRRLKDYFY